MGEDITDEDDKENAENHSDYDEEYDSESTAYSDDLQEEMQQYLQDMGNLRKLIGGDVSRFKDEATARMPLGQRENV